MHNLDSLQTKATKITDELYGEHRHLCWKPDWKLAKLTAQQHADTSRLLQTVFEEEHYTHDEVISPLVKSMLLATLKSQSKGEWVSQDKEPETIEHYFVKELATFINDRRFLINALYTNGSLLAELKKMGMPIQEVAWFKEVSDPKSTLYQKKVEVRNLITYDSDHISLADTLIASLLVGHADPKASYATIEITTFILSLASRLNPLLNLPDQISAFAPSGLS